MKQTTIYRSSHLGVVGGKENERDPHSGQTSFMPDCALGYPQPTHAPLAIRPMSFFEIDCCQAMKTRTQSGSRIQMQRSVACRYARWVEAMTNARNRAGRAIYKTIETKAIASRAPRRTPVAADTRPRRSRFKKVLNIERHLCCSAPSSAPPPALPLMFSGSSWRRSPVLPLLARGFMGHKMPGHNSR